jgi:hypothetical protein
LLTHVPLGASLLKKLTVAIKKVEEHTAILEELEATCGTEQVAKWKQLVGAWQLDHSVKPDPYQEYTEGTYHLTY